MVAAAAAAVAAAAVVVVVPHRYRDLDLLNPFFAPFLVKGVSIQVNDIIDKRRKQILIDALNAFNTGCSTKCWQC